ncbi:MAG: M48 family metalloprotease [Sphingomonadales bacterium]
MRIAALPICASLLLSLTGAAAPPQAPAHIAATTLRADDLRVATVAYRIGLTARTFCPQPYPLTGLLLHHLPEYDAQGRSMEIARYGLDRGPGVLATVEDSPAARAGLEAGDVLLDVDGKTFPDPKAMAAEPDRKLWRRTVEASEAQIEDALRQGPARLRVLRAGQERLVTLDSIPGCPIRIRLARSKQVNAFADGRYVTLTSAILAFVRNDDELAVVIGHELAHNVLGHKERLEAEDVPEGLLGKIGKNAARIRTTEEEADRFGLKLAWAAGYDVTAAMPYWQRFYAAYGGGLQIFRTHPGLRAREQLVEQAIAELSRERRPAAQGDQSR